MWIADHMHAQCVHIHVLRRKLRILSAHFFECPLPQTARMSHGIRLVAHQDAFSRASIALGIAIRVLKRIPDHPLNTLASIHVFLSSNLVGSSLLEDSAEVA